MLDSHSDDAIISKRCPVYRDRCNVALIRVMWLCRYSYRPSVGVLRLLEGHSDKWHVGAELHVTHWCEAVQGMLRKFSDTTQRDTHVATSCHNLHSLSFSFSLSSFLFLSLSLSLSLCLSLSPPIFRLSQQGGSARVRTLSEGLI